MPYHSFSLTLMVTHACNLRCTYCYTGTKSPRHMPPEVGDTAIRRALASLAPSGHLHLGFFGGEPLLLAPDILRWIHIAQHRARLAHKTVSFHLTTNATIDSQPAWELLTHPDLHLSISFDGTPAAHDRFRLYPDGTRTSATVLRTIHALHARAIPFSVVCVLRPQTVSQFPDAIRYLRSLGIDSIEPTLDLWTHWSQQDAANLRRAIALAADLWFQGLPQHALSWFDEKAAQLAGLQTTSPRCGFGNGELAVAPSGNLYPCERLINDDPPDHPLRLPGHIFDGTPDFPPHPAPSAPDAPACGPCSIHSTCNTFCRCSNYIRTGDPRRPDGLLCLLNQACLEEVAARLQPVPHDQTHISLPILR